MKTAAVRLMFLLLWVVITISACGGGNDDEDSNEANNICPLEDRICAQASTVELAAVGQQVTLDASASSNPSGGSLSYRWRIKSAPDNSAAELTNADSSMAMVTPDKAGRYRFALTASAASATFSDDDTVSLYVNTQPNAMVASDREVRTGDRVTLDGSESTDSDGQMIRYEWTLESKPQDSATALDDAASAKPSFVPDVDGDYRFHLVITDRPSEPRFALDSEPAGVTITAATQALAPVAQAGPDQNVVTRDEVILDGTDSADANGDALSYGWSFVSKPDGSQAQLMDADTGMPRFTADATGSYRIRLIVSDGNLDSEPDTVTVTSKRVNVAPNARAGDDLEIFTRKTITLDGSDSNDANGDALSYHWAFQSLPADSAASLSDRDMQQATFTATSPGDYVIQLTVSDGVETDADNVTIQTRAPFLQLDRVSGPETYSRLPFPYSGKLERSISANGKTTLGTYRIRAQGTTFGVDMLSATEANSSVSPEITGLTDGQSLGPNQSATFTLTTPRPDALPTTEQFTFRVLDERDRPVGRFSIQVRLTAP